MTAFEYGTGRRKRPVHRFKMAAASLLAAVSLRHPRSRGPA